ncbi:UNVERIFIED_CONTAM: hypothetical protein GTU68_057152 [Idotea baltica]|nr:hypothetical protein [Idotea baltica]
MSDPVKTKRNGAIFEITLDRPKANAIDQQTSRIMGDVFAEFRDDPTLRVAILTGGGEKFFSAGWDLNEAAAEGGAGYSSDYGQGGLYGFAEMPRLEKPVICAVNGYAIGSGFEVLFAADFVIASENAQMWLPEAQLGVAPDVGTFMLPKMLPPVIANEILFTGRRMTAADCKHWGIINAVVPAEDLMDEARKLADRILLSAPLSVAAIKQTTRLARNMSKSQCYGALRRGDFPLFSKMMESQDSLEGTNAALEGRAPVWEGK